MNIAERRKQAVDGAVARIRDIEEAEGVTRESLEKIREVLLDLAAQEELFPLDEFAPPPAGTQDSKRYLLNEDEGQRFALYLNALNPGKKTHPHNHTTWAVVVAVEGEELNRVYDRRDDGTVAGKATLELAREVNVRPGTGICLMPEDIHSIHVGGDRPARHLHMYGRSLETLTDRLGFDLEKGTATGYNNQYMTPTAR